MLIAVLAALAVAGPAAPGVEVQGVVVKPAAPIGAPVVMGDDDGWIYKPPNAQILSVWPEAAYRARISGKATLDCLIDAHGLAEDCKVISETPAGKGFGSAALLLRPTFKLKPAIGPDGPMEVMRSVTILFNAEDNDDISFSMRGTDMGTREIKMNGTLPEMRSVIMLDHPVWARAASFAELARAYPAKGGGVEGFAVAHCRVERAGDLSACEVRKELPADRGFGPAAILLAGHFRAQVNPADIPKTAPLWVDIPMRFPPPVAGGQRSIGSPTWLAGFDPAKVVKLFPPEAAAKGLTSGRGVARCVVAPDGALTGCAPLEADPEGLGFSEAAVRLTSLMKMNPWTADGGPVDGAVVNIPIRFNLAAKR